MKRLHLKRRVEGVTDYRSRLALLKSGKSRLVVRKTSNNIVGQIVDYGPEGDRVRVSVDVVSLKKLGWGAGANTAAAYLVGYLLGKEAKKKKVSEAILDIGRHPRATKVMAVVKGVVDAGVKVPCDEKVLPSEDRIRGAHVDAYMETAKGAQFSVYKKANVSVAKEFEKLIKKVKGD